MTQTLRAVVDVTEIKKLAGVANFVSARMRQLTPLSKSLELGSLGIETPELFMGHLILEFASKVDRRGYDTQNLFMTTMVGLIDTYMPNPASASLVIELTAKLYKSKGYRALVKLYMNCAQDHIAGRMMA